MLIEKRGKSIKQATPIDSLPRCFLWRCQEPHNCSLPSAPLPFFCLIHHLPLHPSSHSSLFPKCLLQYLTHVSLHCSSSSSISHAESHFSVTLLLSQADINCKQIKDIECTFKLVILQPSKGKNTKLFLQ